MLIFSYYDVLVCNRIVLEQKTLKIYICKYWSAYLESCVRIKWHIYFHHHCHDNGSLRDLFCVCPSCPYSVRWMEVNQCKCGVEHLREQMPCFLFIFLCLFLRSANAVLKSVSTAMRRNPRGLRRISITGTLLTNLISFLPYSSISLTLHDLSRASATVWLGSRRNNLFSQSSLATIWLRFRSNSPWLGGS